MSNSVRARTKRTKRSHMSKHQKAMRERSQFGTAQGLARIAKSKEKPNDSN